MKEIVSLYGLLMIVLGITGLIKASTLRGLIKKASKFADNRPLGALPLVFGIICILSAQHPATRLPSFVCIIGALSIVKALCMFFLEKEKLASCIEFYYKLPESYLKILSGTCIVLGILII